MQVRPGFAAAAESLMRRRSSHLNRFGSRPGSSTAQAGGATYPIDAQRVESYVMFVSCAISNAGSKALSKSGLRATMRAQRQALSATEQCASAMRLVSNLLRLGAFINSRRIAGYYPNDGEIDPRPAMLAAWEMAKSIYLPVLYRARRRELRFAPFTVDTRLHVNRFGISEPRVAWNRCLRPIELDLILVPLVAFDKHGSRIGMGGGFYDRSFAYLSQRRHWRRPRMIGLAHELQRVHHIDRDHWDIPLDGILTDRRFYDMSTPVDD